MMDGTIQVNRDKVAVFDFWATWCGPCKIISPVFENFSSQFSEVEFYKVDVDEQQDIAQEVGVRAVRFSLSPPPPGGILESASSYMMAC